MMVSDTGQNNVHVCSCTSRFDGWHASWTICGLLSRNYESIKNTIKISKARKSSSILLALVQNSILVNNLLCFQ
jgi:hypothetical protein